MRIGKVIGTVTLSRVYPTLRQGQLKIVVPLTFKDISDDPESEMKAGDIESPEGIRNVLDASQPNPKGGELVVYDEMSAGIGEWIAFSEGAEAAMPFYPDVKPIDAYAAAIIDSVEIDQAVMNELKAAK